MTAWKRGAASAALLLCSVIACLGAIELFFRLVVPASDYPRIAGGVQTIRYLPDQSGIYRVRDEIAAPFRINAQGWNSGHATYDRDKKPGTTRVAILGDSYVEALQVPATDSLAEQLERLPGRAPVEAYRFAISGAPFSQYLWMLRHAALAYRPDAVVINLVHNDFDESWTPSAGRYSASFMILQWEGDRITGETAPHAYVAGWPDLLMRSAALRFLRFNRQVSLSTIQALLQGGAASPPKGQVTLGGQAPASGAVLPLIDANVDLRRLAGRPELLRNAIDYMVGGAAGLARERGFRLLLLMDGVREAIYQDRDSLALGLNRLVAEAAARHGVDMIDLHPRFLAAWQRDRRRFNAPTDGHWNAYGHAIAAQAIREWLDR